VLSSEFFFSISAVDHHVDGLKLKFVDLVSSIAGGTPDSPKDIPKVRLTPPPHQVKWVSGSRTWEGKGIGDRSYWDGDPQKKMGHG